MRKRFVVCLAFGAVGLAAALPLGGMLGLNDVQALLGFAAAGVVIGYLISVFLDIFLPSTTETEN